MTERKVKVDVDEQGEILFKSIIIGDAGVGKSCILLRFTKDQFISDYNVTIGVDFTNKIIQLDNDTRVKLQIWDTAGQETFGSIIKKFFRNAHIVFMVYDVNRRETFTNLYTWLANARADCDENAIFVLMGNQADLGDEYKRYRQVTFQEGESFMENNNISFFFETSALSGENIEKAFHEAAKFAFLNCVFPEKPRETHPGLEEPVKPPGKSGCC